MASQNRVPVEIMYSANKRWVSKDSREDRSQKTVSLITLIVLFAACLPTFSPGTGLSARYPIFTARPSMADSTERQDLRVFTVAPASARAVKYLIAHVASNVATWNVRRYGRTWLTHVEK